MEAGKKRQQWWSLVSVIALALILPAILRATNSVVRFLVGAEGRLAAIAVETDRPLGTLPAVWRGVAQGGEELETFLNGAEEEIAEIKPDYIRIDHIYDDFGVVSREGGGLKFSWERLDGVIGKIRETGAKPFLVLSYMPPVISSGSLVDAPRDWNEWAMVVQKTVEHYSGELGIEGIYYEVWNEPDLFGDWRMGGKKDYKNLYLFAARGASAARNVKSFKLGGPATTGLYKNWVEEFFPYIVENNLRLDFFSWHRYDGEAAQYAQDVEDVDRWIEGHPKFATVEKIITELGPRSEVGGANDSRTGAAHLVAVMRELMYRVKYGFTFAVRGSWGIVGKPRYQALKLLTSLGNQRLAVTGEGTWVRAIGAQTDTGYQVLLTNYDAKGNHSEVVPVTFMNLKEREFELRTTFLGGNSTTERVATGEAMLQKEVPMTPNSVVLLELDPVNELQASN